LIARGAYLQRFTPARRIILRILFARFCREMLLSGQMPPPAFAVLLCRAVYFRFSRGLIAILQSGLGFYDCLRLLFPINSAPSGREPFTCRIVRAFLAVRPQA
jgi:hypothetical protein